MFIGNGRRAIACECINSFRRICFVIAIVLIGIGLPQYPAHAEGRCPPGFYPTGGNDVGWLACAPMGPAAENAPDKPDLGPAPDAFMSVVAHRDSPALWTASGYDDDKTAEKEALKICAEQMDDGCHVLWSGFNDYMVAVARDIAGHHFTEGGVDYGSTTSKALADCQEKSIGCQIVRIIVNSTGPRISFPDTTPPINRYAVIGWPKGASPARWQRKYWLVSGIEGLDAAVGAAVSKCKADTGLDCVKGAHSSSGVIVRLIDEAGATYWIDAANAEAAIKRVKQTCPSGKKCRIVELYPAGKERRAILDEDRADQPLRGFYAIAWPTGTSKTQKLSLVTGQPSRAAATNATLALCKRENQAECRPYPNENDADDRGTEQFIAMVLDNSGRIRVEYGYSTRHVEEKMAASCQRDKVTCTGWQVFDLSLPSSQIIHLGTVR